MKVSLISQKGQSYYCLLPSIVFLVDVHTVGFLYPQVLPTMDQKYSEKIPESSKKQNLNLCCYNCLHSVYIVFTMIYVAFTFY